MGVHGSNLLNDHWKHYDVEDYLNIHVSVVLATVNQDDHKEMNGSKR